MTDVAGQLNPSDSSVQEIESARRATAQGGSRYKLNIADREMVLATVATAITEAAAPDVVVVLRNAFDTN